MQHLNLPTCPWFGPVDEGESQLAAELPADYETDPLKYLPPKIMPSSAELELAAQYEKGDFSGGYLTSQIARFRRGPAAKDHDQRREKFVQLKEEVARRGLVLPEVFVALVESDDYIGRLRHNNLWLQLPDELVPLPENPECVLFLFFGEGQGCGFWHLLLTPDGTPIVTFNEHPFGSRYCRYQPDLASGEIYRCADSFSQWIIQFFEESKKEDLKYEELLKKYPGR
jgi:hypothetical protein